MQTIEVCKGFEKYKNLTKQLQETLKSSHLCGSEEIQNTNFLKRDVTIFFLTQRTLNTEEPDLMMHLGETSPFLGDPGAPRDNSERD